MEYIDRNPHIFILSGKAKSGKNLVSKIILEYYQSKKCLELSYAHYLKEYAKNILSWNGEEDGKPRDFLQSLGIDLLKKIDEQFLITRVCQDIEVYRYFYDILIVTDARLKEEIEIPRNKFDKVTVIRIERENFDNGLNQSQNSHITETALDNYTDYDYVILNYNDIKGLQSQVYTILKEVDKYE